MLGVMGHTALGGLSEKENFSRDLKGGKELGELREEDDRDRKW